MADISTSAWKIITGAKPILLVASHNYPQFRELEIKVADVGTGDMVEELCKQLDTNGIVSEALQLDPNWYQDSDFRQMVKNIIEEQKITVVIDIHGRREGSPYLIEYFPNEIFKKLYLEKIDKFKLGTFKDDNQFTLSEDLDSKNIPAIELEIRRDGRILGSETNQKAILEISDLLGKL